MAFDAKTFEADLTLLKTYLGPDTRDDVLDQLKELARQIRVVQMRLAEMADDRPPARSPAARSPISKSVSQDRVTLLRKAVLGEHGGQSILYNKDLAFRLLAKGLISAREHDIWKISGLLPERVSLRDAKPEPYVMARPA